MLKVQVQQHKMLTNWTKNAGGHLASDPLDKMASACPIHRHPLSATAN
jgi:hypothetical protein